MVLPDTNVWLALAFESHAHHGLARQWFEDEGEIGCVFCRLTQQGFLRLASNRKIFGPEALTLTRAWNCFDALLADPRVFFAAEPAGLGQLWRQYTKRRSYSPKIWKIGRAHV